MCGVPLRNVLLDEARRIDPHIEDTDQFNQSPAVLRQRMAVESWEGRRLLQPKYAWAIPNDAALDVLVAASPLVEIGAGTGYWASLLRSRGADVIAYDEKPGRNDWCEHACYTDVLVGDAVASRLHDDRTLFLCWPPMSDMATRALDSYRGRRLVYVGEVDGCCAHETFFAAVERDWVEVNYVQIPQWWGVHDALYVYKRKETR